MRHAVAFKGIDLWQTHLDRVKPEQIGHGFIEFATLPAEHVLPNWRLQPFLKIYNLPAHAFTT